MNANRDSLTARLGEFFRLLDEPRRKFFFACMDCLRAPPSPTGGSLPPNILDVSAFVLSQTRDADADAISDAAAALGAVNTPDTLPSYAPLGYHTSSTVRVQKTDPPVNGTPLLDGQSLSWGDRLRDMAVHASGNANDTLPLISNYKQACQMFSEYACLEFKTVPDNNAADFPLDESQQRELVTLIYEAIIDMSDILERKSPITLKKANTSGVKNSVANNGVTGVTSCQLEPQAESHSSPLPIFPTAQDMLPPSLPSLKPVKDNISVSKVKGLSRIEVWLLSWMILFSTLDIHRGRLPFLPWSKTDWGWDHSFPTFRQRLDAVITTLRRSKAAVCSLLESDYKSRLEAHPIREYRRKENNRAQNSERNAQVFVGRHTISKGKVRRNADGNLCDAEGNIVAPGDADHRGLIDQTVALSQMGDRVQKSKRDDGGPSGMRRSLAGVQKQAKKSKIQLSKISTTKIEATIEAMPASTRPDTPTTKPASVAASSTASSSTAEPQAGMTPAMFCYGPLNNPQSPNVNDPTTIATASGLGTSTGGISPSDVLAPVPSVECDNDLNVKSDEEAEAVADTVPTQLLTPSPELPRLTGFPPLQDDCALSSPDTNNTNRHSQSDGNAELASIIMFEAGSVAQENLGSNLFSSINYAPAGYVDSSNSLYFANNQWTPLASEPCPRYGINSMSAVVDMQNLNGMVPFNVQQSSTHSFQAAPFENTSLYHVDDAIMDSYLGDDTFMQATRLAANGSDGDLFMNMASSGDRDWNVPDPIQAEEVEMSQLPMLGMDDNEVGNWDEAI